MSIAGVLSLLTGALQSLTTVSLGALAVALVLHLAKIAAEARSWHHIVDHAYPASGLRFRLTLGAFTGMIGANAILPARIGEALRLGIVRRRVAGSSVATIASTIVLETAIELVLGVAVILAVLLGGRSLGALGTPGAGLLAVAAHPVVLVGVALAASALALLAFVHRNRARRLAAAMAQGMAVVSAPGRLVRGVLSWKLVAWGLRFAAVYCFLVAFHLNAGLWTVIVVIAAQNLAALLPLAPGNAGTQQAAFAVALAGIASTATILGFGIGMQVTTAAVDVVAGTAAVLLLAARSDVRSAIRPRRSRPVLAPTS